MNSEHLQWLIGLAAMFLFPPLVYFIARRYQRKLSARVHCPACGRCFDNPWDRSEHFRRVHLREIPRG